MPYSMTAMKKLKLLLGVLGTVLAFGGCSMRLKIDLFNNAGQFLTVRTGDKEMALEQGRFVQFYYPGDGQQWSFRISTAKCEFIYQVPRTLEHYPWSRDSQEPLKAQLEPDFSIYLLPAKVNKVGTVSEYSSLQQDGFPLHPASTCNE